MWYFGHELGFSFYFFIFNKFVARIETYLLD